MSWIERIKNKIRITCGDGKSYEPEWINATKQLEWHISEFNFPNLDGTFVKKNKKLGTKYNLEIFFQGQYHLDVSANFEKSLNSSSPLIIFHPFYGILTVQAPAFTVDNTGLNVSKWTGTVIETIVETNPKIKADPVDSIAVQKVYVDELFAKALLLKPNTTDIIKMQLVNTRNFKLTIPLLTIPSEVDKYFNLFSIASNAINTAIASPLLAMRTTIAIITAPAKFTISVTQRINLLNQQFNNLRQTVSGLVNPASKQIYQNLAGSIISSMCLTSSLPGSEDFTNSEKSLTIVETIVTTYNNYVADLDLLQTLNGGTPNSFIPNADSLIALNQLLNLAISNLFIISLSSRNERSIITEGDTNIIVLTHRFYGLDNADKNIDEFMVNNKIGLNEILQIKKGRKIVYYI